MSAIFRLSLTMAAMALASCRYQPSMIHLEGRPRDIARLAGTWVGEFSSIESGRKGTMTFVVVAGADTALGDVVMTPEHGQAFAAADSRTEEHREHARSAEVLRVTFVRIEGGVLRGELEPYEAPDCHCIVTTVFRGVLRDHVIEGEYVTRGPAGLLQEGRWRMTRSK